MRLAGAGGIRFLGVLWRFGRPHTVVGTAASILGIAAICAAELPGAPALGDLAATLLAGYLVNVFIVGLNQIEDVEIDRVNKPELPLAAGDLSPRAARVIVAVAAVAPVAMALTQGAVELVAVAAALLVGWAYSSPPLRLKRFPALAALSIVAVRTLVVHLGVTLHFADSVPAPVWALTAFVLPFSFAIAILKDVPDAEGDRRYRIATFTVRAGPRRVFRAGVAALVAAYAGMALLGPWLLSASVDPWVLAGSHLAALAVLLAWARATDPQDRERFTRFYQRVWRLFFAAYVLVPLASAAG